MISTETTERGWWAWSLVQLIMGTALLFYIGLFAYYGFNEESTRMAIRASAKCSFFLFCAAFGASSIHAVVKKSWSYWLRMNRKYFGISFAFSHWIHLGFIITLQVYFHPIFVVAAPFSLFAGGMAYVWLTLMFLTSFSVFARYLTKKQWTILHTVGGYWIWVIFMSSYTKRAMTEWQWLPFVGLLLLILGLRLFSLYKKSTKN